MADPKTSISDFQRGKAEAYADVVRQAKIIFDNPENDFQDRRAVKTFADRFTRLCGHAELFTGSEQPASLR